MTDDLKAGAWGVCFLAIDPVRAAGIDFTAPYVVIEGTFLVPADSKLREFADVDRDGVRIAVGRGSAYDLFLTRTLKHAQLVREPTSVSALELFLTQQFEAAAGVRQSLATFAKAHANLRLFADRFMLIEQAVGGSLSQNLRGGDEVFGFCGARAAGKRAAGCGRPAAVEVNRRDVEDAATEASTLSANDRAVVAGVADPGANGKSDSRGRWSTECGVPFPRPQRGRLQRKLEFQASSFPRPASSASIAARMRFGTGVFRPSCNVTETTTAEPSVEMRSC